ncbi:MAG TPA: hypothetical protein VFR32_03675 [Gaiellaceae bacterium]|nr:hypothetical protein [Gaiellaceae bacterium]
MKLDLTNAAGRHLRSLTVGRYLVVVSDRSAVENFHLTGPGVDRKTGVKAKGTFRWSVRFRRGVYRYRSDEHPKRARSLTAKPIPVPTAATRAL